MWMQRARVSHKRNRAVLCNGWHSLSHSCGQRPQRGTSDSGLTFLSATSTPLLFLLQLTRKFDLSYIKHQVERGLLAFRGIG